MKNIILIGTFIISLFVTSCNKETLPNKGTANGKTITISANISDDPETRLTYTEESNKLKLGWSEGEKFTMYRGTHSAGEEFTKASGNNNFSGKDPNPTGTGDYYAVYGSNISNASGVLTVDISNQIGTNTENGINSFMVASSTKIDDGSTLNFAHKLTILKLELTFPSGTTGTVKEVIIGGLHNKANYTLATDKYEDYTAENKKYIKATNNGSGFTIKDSKITAYISVFPEAVAEKQVTITAVIGEGTEAVDYSYTMQNAKTLKVGTLLPVSVSLTKMEDNFKSAYTKADYYQWDAWASYDNTDNGWKEGSSGYNPTTGSASASCKDCPTAEQMVAYLKAGVYWDDNTEVIEGQKTYTINGETTKSYSTGLWVKKRRYIENFDSETDKRYTTTTETFTKLSTLTEEEVKNIRTGGEYFFLPACGYYSSGSFFSAGATGHYWSSTPSATGTNSAYNLGFSSSNANVSYNGRAYGFVPMPRL